MGTTKTLADQAFRDFVVDGVQSSGALDPVKSEIRATFEDVDSRVGALEDGQVSSSVAYITWDELAAHPGSIDGARGFVYSNTGGHTDPVTSASILDDRGAYRWSVLPAGWEWLSGDALYLKADKADLDDAVADIEALKTASVDVTQYIDYTDDFANAAWGTAGVTVSSNSIANPINALVTADKIVEDTSNGYHYKSQIIASFNSGDVVTFSAYIKASERSNTRLQIGYNTSEFYAGFDIVTKKKFSNSGYKPWLIDVGGGWFRAVLTFKMPATATITARVMVANASGLVQYQGVSGNGIYAFRANLTNGRFPYQPIATDVAPITVKAVEPDAAIGQLQTDIELTQSDVDDLRSAVSGRIIEVENLAIQSRNLSSISWSKANVTVEQYAATGVKGDLTAEHLTEVEGATSVFHYAKQLLPAPEAGETRTAGWRVKPGLRTKCTINTLSSPGGEAYSALYDLIDGTAYAIVGSCVPGIYSLDNGYFDIVLTYTSTDDDVHEIFLIIANDSGFISYPGISGRGIYVDGVIIETGSTHHAYFDTTTAPVTKSVFIDAPATPAQYTYRSGATTGVRLINNQKKALIFVNMSQSNAMGQTDESDPLLATTALYPGHSLMPDLVEGVHLGLSLKRYTTLADLVEVQYGAGRETQCSGRASALIKKVFDETGQHIKIISFNAAIGAESYETLRGTAFTAFVNGLWDACAAARAQGLDPVFGGIFWTGNEISYNYPPEKHASQMQQLYTDVDEVVRRITGQSEPWTLWLNYSAYVDPTTAKPFDHGVFQGNEIAVARNPNIKLCQPTYNLPHGLPGNEIHLNKTGQNALGQLSAIAIFSHMFGAGEWTPFVPTRVYRSGAAEFTMQFTDLTGATYVMDTSGTIVATAGLPNYYGFIFDDLSGSSPTIASHSISGNKLIFTLSGTPTGYRWRVAYATMRNDPGDPDGLVTGARGCFRKSTAHTMLYSIVAQYEWCLPFIRDIEK